MYSRGTSLARLRRQQKESGSYNLSKIVERTDFTISLRMEIGLEVFVQVFLGELTGSLYFALIERGQRIFGMDRASGEWHLHPYDTPHWHVPLPESPEPKPLLKFLSRVEDLLDEHDLL